MLGAVLFGLLSAYFPPLNAEIYAVAAPVVFPDLWLLHVSAMTGGLVAGKVTHFIAAEKGAEAFLKRHKKTEAREVAKAHRQRSAFRRRLARWSKEMIDVLDRPRLGPLVMLTSSGVGFPPLAVVTVAAGIKRISLVRFTVVTMIGCLARFLVTSWLVVQGIQLGT